MSSKLRSWTVIVLVGLCAAAPLAAQNSFAIACPAQGTPGAQVQCTINLTLAASVQVDALSYDVNVTPSAGAPTVTGIAFTDGLANSDGGGPASHTSGFTGNVGYYSVAWNGLSPTLAAGVNLTGTFKFTIPATAVGGQTYTVNWGSTPAQASFQSAPVTTTENVAQVVPVPSVLTISSPATGATLPTAEVGVAYKPGGNPEIITAAGGTAPYTSFSVTAGSLPNGLAVSLNAGQGLLSGTPTTSAGSPFSFTVTVKDTAGGTATASYTLPVNPAITAVSPTTLTQGTVGAAYTSQSIGVTGGTPPYTFTTTVNLSSYGLSLSPASPTTGTTATISGTPTAGTGQNPLSIPLKVTDANGATFTGNLSLAISGIAITAPPAGALPNGTVNFTYAAPNGVSFTSSGGTAPIAWSVPANTLPPGLTLNASTGALTGTPTTAGPYSFTVTATDAHSIAASLGYSITVSAAPAVTGPNSLALATAGTAYTGAPQGTFTVTGGAQPITWSATGLPTGLTISSTTGAITGSPAVGTDKNSPYSVIVKVTDANGATASATAASLAVDPALTLTPAPPLPVAVPGAAYSQKFTPGGGSGAGYTLAPSGTAIAAGTGLTFTNGTLSGTPPATAPTGNTTLTVTVTDGSGATATFTYTVTIAPPLSISGPASLPAGTVSVGYSQTTVTAVGGTAPYSFSATGLPPGLSINSAGLVSGTPTAVAGSPYSAIVTVTDANRTTATKTYSIAIGALPLRIITGLLPTGVVNAPYPYTSITATGGVGGYTWTVTGLPPGLTTDGNGDISGTPTTTTGSPFSVKATVSDATQTSISRTFSLAITGVLTITAPSTLPGASLNTAYAPVTVTAGGGLPPYTWTATGLPAGMTIAVATGIISGTPTTAAGSPYTVVVTVEDSTGKTATMNYTLAVSSSALTITGPATLPNGTVNGVYTSTTITASGGSGVYTWSATGLPSGLSIGSTTGAITGTPATGTAGTDTDTVTVTVTDSNSTTATKTYTLTVNPASGVPTITGVSTATEAQSFIAPNTWITIYGTNFAAAGFTDNWTNSIKNSSTGALPEVLDNVSAMVGGVPAYVYYLSSTQIDVLTGNIGFGPLAVTVTTAAGTSNAVMITSQADIPGFFEWPNAAGLTPGDTTQQPVATHSDYSDAAANGTFTTATVPAKPGETIILWGSGFGTTSPANPFGVAVPSTGGPFVTTGSVSVMLNNAPVTVINSNAILTPSTAGLYQLAVTVPSTLANGTYPITVTVGGTTSPTLSLAVHN